MTTGENLVVTWDNVVAQITAWMGHVRYHDGAASHVIEDHEGTPVYSGIGVIDVAASVITVPANRRDEFCDRVRYWYGGCINLEESRAIDPKLLK